MTRLSSSSRVCVPSGPRADCTSRIAVPGRNSRSCMHLSSIGGRGRRQGGELLVVRGKARNCRPDCGPFPRTPRPQVRGGVDPGVGRAACVVPGELPPSVLWRPSAGTGPCGRTAVAVRCRAPGSIAPILATWLPGTVCSRRQVLLGCVDRSHFRAWTRGIGRIASCGEGYDGSRYQFGPAAAKGMVAVELPSGARLELVAPAMPSRP
jgi:hypothetical protein